MSLSALAALALVDPLAALNNDSALAREKSAVEVYKEAWDAQPAWKKILQSTAMVGGAYHGYKRNDSALWAVLWMVFGSAAPMLAIPIALAQGFGKRKKG